jgi:hypothetical protein
MTDMKLINIYIEQKQVKTKTDYIHIMNLGSFSYQGSVLKGDTVFVYPFEAEAHMNI